MLVWPDNDHIRKLSLTPVCLWFSGVSWATSLTGPWRTCPTSTCHSTLSSSSHHRHTAARQNSSGTVTHTTVQLRDKEVGYTCLDVRSESVRTLMVLSGSGIRSGPCQNVPNPWHCQEPDPIPSGTAPADLDPITNRIRTIISCGTCFS